MLNWKIIAVVAKVVLLVGTLAEAQVVKVESRWNATRKLCGPNGCQIVKTVIHDWASGTVVGKTAGGQSLVLSCEHFLDGENGTEFAGIFADGKKAHVLRRSDKDDLSLLWVEADLGKPLPISKVDPQPGATLSVKGFDKSSTQVTTRTGTLKEKDMVSVTLEQGNSGGPVIGNGGAIYGVAYGRPKGKEVEKTGWVTASNGVTYFVPASRVNAFVTAPRPIGGIMFYNPFQALCPPQCEPPIEVPPEVPPEGFRVVPQPVLLAPRRVYVQRPTVLQAPPPSITVLPAPSQTIQIPAPRITVGAPPAVHVIPSAPRFQVLPGRVGPSVFGACVDGDVEARLGALEAKVGELDGRVLILEGGSLPPNPSPGDIVPRVEILERNVQTLDQRVRALEGGLPQGSIRSTFIRR